VEQAATRMAEAVDRSIANIDWLEHIFDLAEQQDAAGVALFLHADMWHPGDRTKGRDFYGHQSFVEALSDRAAEFGKPVIMLSGDSHNFREDVPVEWFTLYRADNQDNVTQIIVDRSIEDDINWLRLHVDPKSSAVFSWEQVTVE
jgi:hypothetical protein